MSNAASFFKAARPEPPRIIGLQLRPYSLGHHILLHAYDSSFLIGVPKFSDLILGIFICSQSWASWESWRNSWKLPIFLKVWSWFYRKFDVRAAGDEFTRYIQEGSECPEIAVPAGGRPLSASWESRLKLFLIRELKLTATEALDYPLALAWQEYCAHGEAAGNITMLTEADKASIEFIGSNRMKDLIAEAESKAVEEMKAKTEVQQPIKN